MRLSFLALSVAVAASSLALSAHANVPPSVTPDLVSQSPAIPRPQAYQTPPFMFTVHLQTKEAPVKVEEVLRVCIKEGFASSDELDQIDAAFSSCLGRLSAGMLTAFPRELNACRMLTVPNGDIIPTGESTGSLPVLGLGACIYQYQYTPD